MSTEPGGDIDKIVELYKNFDPRSKNPLVKYVKKEDLYYYEVTIQQPYQRNFCLSKERIDNLYGQKAFASLYDEDDYLDLFNKRI